MIEVRGLTKHFGSVTALDGVDLDIKPGTIHVLLGENGAGKSTLMKILYGMYSPDAGTIVIDGRQTTVKNSHQAIQLGIGMVHQNFMLVDEFTGYENVVLGFEPAKGFRFDRKAAKQKVDDLAREAGVRIDASRKVRSMTVGERQKIEILKLLYRKSPYLILDEPTAVLTPNEVEDLFAMIRILKGQGKAIILITHKLHEALSIADTITILRDGRVVRDGIAPGSVSQEQVASLMVGREVSLYARRPARGVGGARLEVGSITYRNSGGCDLEDLSFKVHAGEILGVAGVDGNGQTEMVEALAAIGDGACCEMRLEGKKVPAGTRNVLDSGMGFVFEDRSYNGLIPDMPVTENIILGYHRQPSLRSGVFLNLRKIRQYAKKLIDDFGIKTESDLTPAGHLSGGNQQKILLARVLGSKPSAAVISQPTRGVDIGAMEFIHKAIFDYRDEGNSVLLVSADLDEVKSLSDRMLVMCKGKIVAEGSPADFSDSELGLLMTGAKEGPSAKEVGA